jgi:virginiamycin B lyase
MHTTGTAAPSPLAQQGPRCWLTASTVAVLLCAGCGGVPEEGAEVGGRPSSSAASASATEPSAVLAMFDVGGDGWAMAATRDHLWIQVDEPVDSIVRVDKRTGEATPMVPKGHRPEQGPSGLWVVGGDWVVNVDPTTGKQSRRVPHGGGFTMAGGHGWLDADDGTVYRVNLKTGKLATVASHDPALCASRKDIAMAFGVVWLACKEGHVVKLPLDGGEPSVIPTGLGSHTFAVTDEALWVTNYEEGTMSRIDPRTEEVTTTKGVGSGIGITVGGGYVWSSDSMGIAKIDPLTGKVVDHLTVAPGSYYELVWDEGVIWASTRGSDLLKIDATS